MRQVRVPPVLAWLRKYAPAAKIYFLADDSATASLSGSIEVLDWKEFEQHLPASLFAGSSLRKPDGQWNLGLKRTAALNHANCSSFKRVLFVDDDIQLVNAIPLFAVDAALETQPIASAISINSPDRSAFGHALATIHKQRAIMPSASFLGIRVGEVNRFFPNNYNEDWFFFLLNLPNRPIVASSVFQMGRELIGDEDAANQEHYDFIAEAAWHAADNGNLGAMLDIDYWRFEKERRKAILHELTSKLCHIRAAQLKSIADMTKQLDALDPRDCIHYMTALFSHRQFHDGYDLSGI